MSNFRASQVVFKFFQVLLISNKKYLLEKFSIVVALSGLDKYLYFDERFKHSQFVYGCVSAYKFFLISSSLGNDTFAVLAKDVPIIPINHVWKYIS